MWEMTVDMEHGQISVFTPVSHRPSDLLKHAPKTCHIRKKRSGASPLFSQRLILTVHKPVEQLRETMWSMFTRMSAFLMCWCENRKIVFSVCVSITLHLTPVPLTCLIIKFYFNPRSYVYVCTPDTGLQGRLQGATHSKRASGCLWRSDMFVCFLT